MILETGKMSAGGTPRSCKEVSTSTGRLHVTYESKRVQNVTADQLNRQRVGPASCDTPELTNPGENTVDGVQGGNDAQHVAEDQAGDAETEPGALGERVERIVRLGSVGRFVVLKDGGLAHGDGLARFGHHRLGERDRGRDGHEGRREQVLGRDAERDIGDKDGTGDRGEPRDEGLVDLRIGHMLDVGSDEDTVFTLADEG